MTPQPSCLAAFSSLQGVFPCTPQPPCTAGCRVGDLSATGGHSRAPALPSPLAMALIPLIKIISSGSHFGEPGLNLFAAGGWAHTGPHESPLCSTMAGFQASPQVLTAPAYCECSIPGSASHPPVTDQPQPPEWSRTSSHNTGGVFPTHLLPPCRLRAPIPAPQPACCHPAHLPVPPLYF